MLIVYVTHILEKHTPNILIAYGMEYITLTRSVSGVNENGLPWASVPTGQMLENSQNYRVKTQISLTG